MLSTTGAINGVLRLLLLMYLLWIPLPFGSVTEFSRFLLIFSPLYIALWALGSQFFSGGRESPAIGTRLPKVWTAAALVLIAGGFFQLLPLPDGLLSAISPVTQLIQNETSEVLVLMGERKTEWVSLSVHRAATSDEILRVTALLALLLATSILLVRSRWRRLFAATVTISAMFQALYSIGQLSSTTYNIWGWENVRLGGQGRVSGTYVSPNHFAHYLALAFPLALYLAASGWQSLRGRSAVTRLREFLETSPATSAFGLAGSLCILAGILLSRSRGALLALVLSLCGLLCLRVLVHLRRLEPSSRRRRRKLKLEMVAMLVLFAAAVGGMALYLGGDVLSRFSASLSERSSLSGRLDGIRAALGIVRLFPWAGSGAGTFADVVLMAQKSDQNLIFNHAHNDYLQLAATMGLPLAVVILGLLAAGYVRLVRAALSADRAERSEDASRFILAVTASLTVAAVHACFDFNFFIPANAATLAAIAGAGVAGVCSESARREVSNRWESPDEAEGARR